MKPSSENMLLSAGQLARDPIRTACTGPLLACGGQRMWTGQATPDQNASTSMTKINYVAANFVALAGLLSGAAIVHNVYRPDLTIPLAEADSGSLPQDSKVAAEAAKLPARQPKV